MSRPLSRFAIVGTFAAALMVWTPAFAEQPDPRIIELQRQLQERDAEIAVLRQELQALRQQRGVTADGAGRQTAPVAEAGATRAGDRDTRRGSKGDDSAAALERALLLRGGGILPPGVVEAVPEFFYVYDEPIRGVRRDTFGTALTTRLGLPRSTQADLTVPFIVRDHQSNYGNSSGVGDVRVGLTKQLLSDYEHGTMLFVRGEWRAPTGSIKKRPPTGFGQDGARVVLTVTKQDDPLVLFGNVSHTWNLGSARLSNGMRLDSGNVFGGRFGAFLAATPDTSLLAAISLNSSDSDRIDDRIVAATDRLRGSIEFGITNIISRNLFIDLNADIGFTRAAPDLVLSFSLPYRF